MTTRYRRPAWLVAIVLIVALIRGCVAIQRSQDDGDREEQIRQGMEMIDDLGRSCVASGGMWNRFQMECIPLPPGTPAAFASPPAAAIAAATRAAGHGATPLASAVADVRGPAMFRGDAARTGFLRGSGPAEAPVAAWQVPLGQAGDDLYGAPVAAGGFVYVGGPRNVLLALDAVTGAERWQQQPEGLFTPTSPVVAGDTHYVAADLGGTLVALEAATGVERWRYANRGISSTSEPATGEGVLYVVQTAYEPRVYSPVLYALVPPAAATPEAAATP